MDAGLISFTYDSNVKDFKFVPEIVRGPGDHSLACPRYPVRKLMAYDADGNLDRDNIRNLLPPKYVESLEQNQQLATCCRHPENHDIEAWYSNDEERAKGIPNIYILHCSCGRQHKRFCVGQNPPHGEKEVRPFWTVR